MITYPTTAPPTSQQHPRQIRHRRKILPAGHKRWSVQSVKAVEVDAGLDGRAQIATAVGSVLTRDVAHKNFSVPNAVVEVGSMRQEIGAGNVMEQDLSMTVAGRVIAFERFTTLLDIQHPSRPPKATDTLALQHEMPTHPGNLALQAVVPNHAALHPVLSVIHRLRQDTRPFHQTTRQIHTSTHAMRLQLCRLNEFLHNLKVMNLKLLNATVGEANVSVCSFFIVISLL